MTSVLRGKSGHRSRAGNQPISPFHGPLSEAELPREIDTFLLGDQTKEPFTQRFRFRK
jgi:hypothetical protein